MIRSLHLIALAAGLGVIAWVAAGYVGTNTLALAITVLIAAFHLVGSIELLRQQRDTASLSRSLVALNAPPADLPRWLDGLPVSLQTAVQQRIDGTRTALPGPALTPYLSGLLVLLGMLGTFLGMVVTLDGTGLALQHAGDLQAMRDTLSAPVRGLGLAFGTSVAGVAGSAMLGLVTALGRRERAQVTRLLDRHIATTLRTHTPAHRRDEAWQLMQQQARQMPELLNQLQAWMQAVERQSGELRTQLTQGQDRFHEQTLAAYTRLAASVDESLRRSLVEAAQRAGASLQPVVEATMAGISRDTTQLHQQVAQSMAQHQQAMAERLDASTTALTASWSAAVADQRQANASTTGQLQQALGDFTHSFEQRSSALVEALSRQLGDTTSQLGSAWHDALREQALSNQALGTAMEHMLQTAAAGLERHASLLTQTVAQAHAELQDRLAHQDHQRLSAWATSLETTAGSMQRAWQQAGERMSTELQSLCATLAATADRIGVQGEAQVRSTVAEVARLVETASQAPQAAAEVIAELREKLSDSLVRDNAMLDERSRILGTLATLLDAVQHASGEQRSAIDALLATSADLLERAGRRFADTVEAEGARLADVSAQVSGSAVEVASLGEAFGHAVELFGQSNERLVGQLQRIEAALNQSLTRSDEQLGYYVAQAREVIDLSLSSQKQIIDDLHQLAGQRALAANEA